jgi:c(7)-type cytochrome triheme protein
MRAAIIVVMIATAALAIRVAHADGPRTAAIVFDHNVHDRDVVVSGAESLPCTRCHTLKAGLLVGRPDHASCFGSCHGAAPRTKPGAKLAIPEAQLKVCMRCHAESALLAPRGKALAVTFPPYRATDFALNVGHKIHSEITCTQCHIAKPAAAHRRCAGCHDGAQGRGSVMTACNGCHVPGSGTPDPPRLMVPTNTVTSTFSHAKHAARGGAGAPCVACHAEIRGVDDNILPRPKASACGTTGCHDGAPTFAVTAACTKCHEQPPQGKFIVARPSARFSHAQHQDAKLACAACHPQGKTGEVLVAGHAACASCHAADFAERAPTICGACHNATEPWRKLVADRLPPERTEFGATLDHTRHTAACTSCHVLTTTTTQLRPPRGHGSCMTAGCHAVRGGPAPQLDACEACHALGLTAKRVALRRSAPWSVRAMFDHAPHQRAKDGTALPCASCHDNLEGASVASLAAPPKKACAPCHDGATSFKLTGTSCMRCHTGAK